MPPGERKSTKCYGFCVLAVLIGYFQHEENILFGGRDMGVEFEVEHRPLSYRNGA